MTAFHCACHFWKLLSATAVVHDKMQIPCSKYMNMWLSRVIVEPNVVQQQIVISDVHNRLVHRNERVLSVVRHQDNVKQLVVVVILSHTVEALVIVLVHLIASIS